MATKAYVLVETTVGTNREVIAGLQKLEEVTRVDLVTGPFDVIAVVEAVSLAGIGEVLTGRIHPIPGVTAYRNMSRYRGIGLLSSVPQCVLR